ncbi:MAG: glycosyltransferase, partial [Scytonema sp. PMC 1069.18]|nr:glycosyltransferase [Scytonema sp. PMC 1069.18]
ATYIGKTLDSVLSQTYTNFEVIVCDDGSTDNSCNIIKSYVQKDSRIQLICQQNKRVAAALNTAYRESQGQIICILDADDIWIPSKLQKVLEVFKLNRKCGFVIHNVIQIDGQDNFIKSIPMLHDLASGWMAQFALENGGLVKNIPPASALSFRREVTNLIFPLNEAIVRNTDSLIYRLAPLITEIGAVPEVLSHFRLHGTNTTSATILTIDTIERTQASAKAVYQEQKKFLQKIYGSEIADKLTEQHHNIKFCYEGYLLARLKHLSKSERKQIHRLLITHPEFNTSFSWSNPHRWLIQWDLPNVLFMVMFQHLYQPTFLKHCIKYLLGEKLTANLVRG